MHSELTSVPAMFYSRVKRIMPFLTHNIYLANTRLSSSLMGLTPTADPQQQQQHLEACLEQSKPWEWLEDYVSEPPHDNDAPISLSLFSAKKMKRAENTYVRWFKFGFDDGTAHDVSDHISIVDSRNNIKSRDDTLMDENGFIFIVDDDEEMDPSSLTGTVGAKSNLKKRRADMEDGELP